MSADSAALVDELQRIVAEQPGRTDATREALARRAAEAIRRATGFHWVGLYDVEPEAIVAIAWTGDAAPAFLRFPRAQGLNGAAVSDESPVVANDVARDRRYLTTFGATRAEMIVPVRGASGEVVGTIDVESTAPDAFGPAQQELVERCARALSPLWNR